MLIIPRAVLLQQLFKLGATQSSFFGDLKATMPAATEALPGNGYCVIVCFVCIASLYLMNREKILLTLINLMRFYTVLSTSVIISLRFNHHFPGGPGLAYTRMSPFWILLELRMMEVVVKTGAVRRANLQSNHHHQQTNTLFTGRMPFVSPNQQCHGTERNVLM